MKKIEAIIRPSKLKAVQIGLKEAVKGTGLQKSYAEHYRGSEQTMILQTRVMIICVVSDENLEKCINVFMEHASSGQVGDGKIFIYDVMDAIRISTQVRGSAAIK